MTDCDLCEVQENNIYEDEKVKIAIPAKSITKGHYKIIPKEHHGKLQEFDNKYLEHIFYAASFSATALFENLQAQGTNIIANTGSELKDEQHFHVNVISRTADDGLNFLWKPKEINPADMDDTCKKIKDKCDMMGQGDNIEQSSEQSSEKPTQDEHPKIDKEDSTEHNKTHLQEKDLQEVQQKSQKKNPDRPSNDNESYLIKQLRRIP